VSADLINLRNARKNKQRSESEKLAEVNRAKFGRSKNEKKITAANKLLEMKSLDGLKRET
jgi:Domain of unknown function (DUF4169)